MGINLHSRNKQPRYRPPIGTGHNPLTNGKSSYGLFKRSCRLTEAVKPFNCSFLPKSIQ